MQTITHSKIFAIVIIAIYNFEQHTIMMSFVDTNKCPTSHIVIRTLIIGQSTKSLWSRCLQIHSARARRRMALQSGVAALCTPPMGRRLDKRHIHKASWGSPTMLFANSSNVYQATELALQGTIQLYFSAVWVIISNSY